MGKYILHTAMAIAFTLSALTSQAQSPLTKPITKEELIGTWNVVAFFPGTFGENFPESSHLAASQIYGFYEDGYVRSLVSDEKKNFNYTLSELESRFGSRPKKLQYTFLEKGLVAITIDDKKEIGTLWQAHKVTKEGHSISDLKTKTGDIIMGMTPEEGSKSDDFRYIRIMRPAEK